MSLIELLDNIESPLFAAELSIASSDPVFIEILTGHPLIKDLEDRVRSSRPLLDRVFTRFQNLAASRINTRLENPADSALAAYVWVLYQHGSRYSDIAVTTGLSAPNTWWCRRLCTLIMNQTRHLHRTEEQYFPLFLSPTPPGNIWEVLSVPSEIQKFDILLSETDLELSLLTEADEITGTSDNSPLEFYSFEKMHDPLLSVSSTTKTATA